jgi:hypothetical protein
VLRRPAAGKSLGRRGLEEDMTPDDVPRLVAWLRSERPSATPDEIASVLGSVGPERVRHLEQILDDLARGCRPPGPADLAALTELDELLAR